MRFSVSLLILFALFSGCNKPDSHPWEKDPIYQDMQGRKKNLEAKLASEEEQGTKFEEMLRRAAPQTGQERNARMKLENQNLVIMKTRQELLQLKFSLESRAEEAQRDYLKAFADKKSWPNPEDFEEYKIRQAVSARSRTWKVADRIKEMKGATAPPKKAEAEE